MEHQYWCEKRAAPDVAIEHPADSHQPSPYEPWDVGEKQRDPYINNHHNRLNM